MSSVVDAVLTLFGGAAGALSANWASGPGAYTALLLATVVVGLLVARRRRADAA